jgi:predicted TIM-barrel fold metal-dependent hydrolase
MAGSDGAAAGPEIVDTHIHLYDPTRPQGVPWPPKSEALLYKPTLPGAYAALVRPLGVTRAVVVEASEWVEDNQWVLDLAKENSIIAGLVGHLTPGTSDFRAQLERFGRNALFRGIRLNGAVITRGVTSAAFIEDLQRLAGAGLMLDAIGNAGMIPSLLRITDKIPTLRMAIDHMPSEPPGWLESRAAMRELAKRQEVYSKVSGAVGAAGELLDEVWEMFGADRVMYGSNWPVSERQAPYATVLGGMKKYLAGKGAAMSEKYFWKNSLACYRWGG